MELTHIDLGKLSVSALDPRARRAGAASGAAYGSP